MSDFILHNIKRTTFLSVKVCNIPDVYKLFMFILVMIL